MSRNYYRVFITLTDDKPGYGFNDRTPSGRCVIEARGESGKITLSVQNLKPNVHYKAYALASDGWKSAGVPLGRLSVNSKGKGELNISCSSSNILDSKISLESINVVALIVSGGSVLNSPLVGYTEEMINWKKGFWDVSEKKSNLSSDDGVTPLAETAEPQKKVPASVLEADADVSAGTGDGIRRTAEIAEKKKLAEAAELAEKKKLAEAAEFAEAKKLAEAAELAEAKKLAEAAELAEAKKLAEAAELAEAKMLAEAAELAEADPVKATELTEASELAEQSATEELLTVNATDTTKKACSSEKEIDAEEVTSAEEKPITKEPAKPTDSLHEPNCPNNTNTTEATAEEINTTADKPNPETPNKLGAEHASGYNTGYDSDYKFFTKTGGMFNDEGQNLHEAFRAMAREFNQETEELKNISFLPDEDYAAPEESYENQSVVETGDDLDFLFHNSIEMTPFKSQRRQVKWVRVSLKELVLLPIEPWLYMNHPFVVSGYERFRHLIMGLENKNAQRQFYIGVPDVYDDAKAPRASELGFIQFKCCEDGNPKAGEYGYWLMPVE